MFNNSDHSIQLPVVISLTTGERLTGDLVLTRVQPLAECLNRPDPFVTFINRDGRTMIVGKHAIASAAEFVMPERDQMKHASFEPHHLLGVSLDASPATIREAYLTKVRQYHPDHFASVSLPDEVTQYLRATFLHIQMAYEELMPKKRHDEPVLSETIAV